MKACFLLAAVLPLHTVFLYCDVFRVSSFLVILLYRIMSLVPSFDCVNCVLVLKVRPQYQVCRDSVSQCDVPEFCDGISGQVSVISGNV